MVLRGRPRLQANQLVDPGCMTCKFTGRELASPCWSSSVAAVVPSLRTLSAGAWFEGDTELEGDTLLERELNKLELHRGHTLLSKSLGHQHWVYTSVILNA
jgi:hypothetical protein